MCLSVYPSRTAMLDASRITTDGRESQSCEQALLDRMSTFMTRTNCGALRSYHALAWPGDGRVPWSLNG